MAAREHAHERPGQADVPGRHRRRVRRHGPVAVAEHRRRLHRRDHAGPDRLRPHAALVHARPPGGGAEGLRFAGRTAIVTGGGSGIGRVIAQRFAAEGAAVVVADWGAEKAEAVAGEIEAAGGRALATHTDVSRGADVAAMHEAAVAAFGAVHVLVNNAAIADADGVLETDESEWDHELAVVLKSAFLCSRAVLPAMLERGSGVIVNIATVNAYSFLANEAYSAAKAGLVNLTQSIAVRYGHRGVRCVAIAPGTIRTPVW